MSTRKTWSGFRHAPYPPTAFPVSETVLRVRLKTPHGVRRAAVLFGDRYAPQDEDRLVPMRFAGEGMFGVWWETDLPLSTRRFRYAFYVEIGGKGIWFGEAGISPSRREAGVFQVPYVYAEDVPSPPAWAADAVAYQIFPDRFAVASGGFEGAPRGRAAWGSPPTPESFFGGDLVGIREKLDVLADLGVNLIYLTPIFTAPSNHRYDTEDYLQVDPRLGGNEALRALVDAAHARGMRILLDGVFNHAGERFFAFRDVLRRGRSSPYAGWFWFPGEFPVEDGVPRYETFATGVWSMPKLNLLHPEAREYFLRVGENWVREFGIDGWRLDVANEVPTSFWREFRRRVKAVRPDALLVGEIWHDALPWLRGDVFDGVTHYRFRELAVAFLAEGGLSASEFARHLLDAYFRYPSGVWPALWNLVESHDTKRFLTLVRGDRRLFRLAVFLQMALPGMPLLYYGSEVGLEGGDDPDNRRTYPWDPAEQDLALRADVRRLVHLRRKLPQAGAGSFAVVAADDLAEAIVVYRRGGSWSGLFAWTRSPRDVRLRISWRAFRRYGISRDEVVHLAAAGREFLGEGEVRLRDPGLELELSPFGRLWLVSEDG
ncbi:glycoside hydrolase family 13 protein [Brockia lithotrophica]|uniref:Glycosidase n=1 Tax=Brockia lithotrophica TaxID=933949 RepID=A0A660KVH5_9BACL|nr:glycoside hydrolase family 13 protein [Brockia lithotrophica]RKQ84127.1 glycosidase [Brockia lithotrophica]